MNEELLNATEDKRPDPKPRKHPELWQSYLWWHELMEMRKRHNLRIISIERGKSNLDADFERHIMTRTNLEELLEVAKQTMIEKGEDVGPIWDWLQTIKGLGAGGLAAQLLAQIDDIAKSDTVSALWRFCGYAVVDGRAERCKVGEKAPYNRKLKSICWLIGDQFIRQQTPLYVDVYYEEKERLRALYPITMCRDCKVSLGCDVPWDDCTQKKAHKRMYNDGHLHNMARRKMVKIFLQFLWVRWRETEGLPVSEPYVQAILGHTGIITARPA